VKWRHTISDAAARGWNGFANAGDTPLVSQSRLAGPMPWVIAIMVALTVIAAAGGLALRNIANVTAAELSGGITIQIVEARPEERARQADAALNRLNGMAGIAAPRLVPAKELDALVEPWLGKGLTGGDAIPVPALIDARMTGKVSPVRMQQLQQQLREVAPAARVDAQAGWLEPVFDAIRSLQWLAFALVVLLAFAMAAAVLLAARNALGANRDTIEIVHFLGGTDVQIANIFQRSVGADAVAGGIAGFAFAAGAIWLLGQRFAALGAGMVGVGALGLTDWLVLVMVPLTAAILAMGTARFSVMQALRKML
jgi:cell division transport system permease protein